MHRHERARFRIAPARAASVERLEHRRLLAYTWTPDSFENIDLTPSNATVLLDNSDDGFAAINLGSNTFRFYDETYTGNSQLFVSVNGLITFGSGTTSSNNSDLKSTPNQRAIAPLWDNWDTSEGTNSQVLYRIDTQRDELIIEWQNVVHVNVGGNNGVTFQAILELNEDPDDNGNIEFNYVDLGIGNPTYNNGASATVGVKNLGNSAADKLLILFNSTRPEVADMTAIEIEDESSSSTLDVEGFAFHYATAPQRIDVDFNRDVFASLQASDLQITLQGGGSAPQPTSFTWDSVNFVARFTFASPLPSGRYLATLPAGAVQTAGGQTISSDRLYNFLFQVGDANNDGRVNLADFNTLAANFGQSPRDYTQGDFNYDGLVNLADFNLLAGNFGTQIAPETTQSNATSGTLATRRSPFGTRPIREIGLGGEDESILGLLK